MRRSCRFLANCTDGNNCYCKLPFTSYTPCVLMCLTIVYQPFYLSHIHKDTKTKSSKYRLIHSSRHQIHCHQLYRPFPQCLSHQSSLFLSLSLSLTHTLNSLCKQSIRTSTAHSFICHCHKN